MHHIRGQKLGVIVELGRQVEALIAWAIAIARQPGQVDDPLRGLGRIGLQSFDIVILRQTLRITRSATSRFRHFEPSLY
jgi:hypothetical protein